MGADCLAVLEVLHRALMLFGGRPTSKRAEVSTFAGAGVGFARVQPVFPRAEFADHGDVPFFDRWTNEAAFTGAGSLVFSTASIPDTLATDGPKAAVSAGTPERRSSNVKNSVASFSK
jgi:hypothetical protein